MSKKEKLLNNISLPDITERKRAEEALKESEEKFRTFMETASDLMHIADKDGNITYVNESMASTLGYSKDEMIGKHVTRFLSKEILEKDFKPNWEKLITKGEIDIEAIWVTKDGKEIYGEIKVVATYDSDGKYAGSRAVFRDLTERKRMEERITQAAKEWRTTFDSISSPIAIQDKEFKLLRVNKAYAYAVKKEPRELIGKRCYEVLHGSKKPWPNCPHLETMKTEKPTTVEFFEPNLGAYLQLSTSPIFDDKRQVVGSVHITTDITERKQAEETLKSSEERLKILFEFAPDAYYLNDLKGNLVDGNKAAEEITGYKRDELIGKNFLKLKLLSTGQIPKAAALLAKNALGQTTGPDEFILNRKDGNQVPVEIRTFPVKVKGQTLVLAIARDITERKRAEEELRLFSHSVESSVDGVALGNLNGKITYGNKAFVRMFGYSKEELIGNEIAFIYSEDQIPKLKEAIKATMEGGWTGELIGKRKDGELFPIAVSSSRVVDDKGNVIAIMANHRDITERKRMERMLQEKNEQLDAQNEELRSQAEELMTQQQELIDKTREVEAASQAKSQFLASMSHELRTPLNAIIGFSELILDGVPGGINDEQRQCLNDIYSSGQHLLDLINDVLDLSKVEAGKIELKLESLNLSEVIHKVVQAVKPMLDDNRHVLEVGVEDGLPPVRADRTRLRQIFFNLLSNAVKFTPPGGELGIEVSRNGDWCQVSVVDNGIGIRQEDQERIFETFSRGETLPDREREGTGLGLALTKQFVEMFGGRIWVESQHGKGSRFTFTLPLATAD